jgi:hypothetical protein
LARREKIDRVFQRRLDEFERRILVLKIEYEKFFSGIDQIEPLRERDDMRRLNRELQQTPITNTAQKHKVRSLRARWNSMEMYWQRNLVMIERGTHPKMKFRARLAEKRRGGAPAEAPKAAARPRRLTAEEREDKAYQAVFDKYVETRQKCGQGTDLAYESVRDVLKKQVRTIKSRYRCKSVKFKITVEDGKAKVKAVPLR